MICSACTTTNGPAALFCQGCGMSLESLRRLVGALGKTTPEPGPPMTGGVCGGSAHLVPSRDGLPLGPGWPLAAGRVVVGRASSQGPPPDLDLALAIDAGAVSRRHALLTRGAAGWLVEDLGSTNGTRVRRRGEATFSPPLAGPTPLGAGDELAFGQATFLFREG